MHIISSYLVSRFPVLSLLPFLPPYLPIRKSDYATFQLQILLWLQAAVRIKSIFLHWVDKALPELVPIHHLRLLSPCSPHIMPHPPLVDCCAGSHLGMLLSGLTHTVPFPWNTLPTLSPPLSNRLPPANFRSWLRCCTPRKSFWNFSYVFGSWRVSPSIVWKFTLFTPPWSL